MFSYLYSLVYGDDEIKADEKALRQKYLVLLQIKDNKLRLKPIDKPKKKVPSKIFCSYKKNKLP